MSNLHQFGLACTIYAGDFKDFLPPGANDMAHFSTTSWNLIFKYGPIYNAAACQSIWRYPGGAKALFSHDIDGAVQGAAWVHLGWVRFGDTQPNRSPLTGSGGNSVDRRPQKASEKLDPSSDTLVVCQHWDGTLSGGWRSFMRHVKGSASVVYPLGVKPNPSPEGLAVGRLGSLETAVRFRQLRHHSL